MPMSSAGPESPFYGAPHITTNRISAHLAEWDYATKCHFVMTDHVPFGLAVVTRYNDVHAQAHAHTQTHTHTRTHRHAGTHLDSYLYISRHIQCIHTHNARL